MADAPAPRAMGTPGRGRDLAAAVGLVAIGVLAYANAVRAAFVYDDHWVILDNPAIRSLSGVLAHGGWSHTRVLGFLSFALDFRRCGPSPSCFHLTNVLIHLTGALLLYALVVLTFRSPRVRGSSLEPQRRAIAFVAAALFVAHPVQTQAVTYVTQRFTSLTTLFCLAALVSYAAWRLAILDGARGRVAWFVLALAADLAAMRTKEIAFALPFGLLLYEAIFFDGPWRRRAGYLLPFALTLAIIPANYLLRPPGPARPDQPAPLGHLDYLVTQIAVTADYVRMILWPSGQALDHAFPVYTSLLAPRVVASLGVIAVLAGVAVLPLLDGREGAPPRRDPAGRIASFGIAWFFLGLAPQSSLVPNPDLFMEHRIYLPSVGAAMAAATGLGLLAGRLRTAHPGRIVVLGGLAVSLVLATATMIRNEVWRSEILVWRDSASKEPSTSRSHANLGTLLLRAGQPEAGIEELGRAVALAPGWPWPRAQLGAALLQAGRAGEAESELRQALAGKPDDPEACFNLGMLLARTGRGAEARPYLERFVRIAPESYEAARRTAAAWLARNR